MPSNGYARFAGRLTTVNQIVPISCNEGHELVGPGYIVCFVTGQWRSNSMCRIKGRAMNMPD